MANMFTKQLGTSLLLASLVITAACTKTREAKFAEDEAAGTFAISDLDTVGTKDSSYSLKTTNEVRELSQPETTRATNEKGMVAVDVDSLQVPSRLRYMFNNLEVSGQADQAIKLAFTVDSKAVTAMKVVDNINDLSLLEQQIAMSKEELALQKKITSSGDANKTQKLVKQLADLHARRGAGPLYVPVFRFAVKNYGVVLRTKNSLGEETSSLQLKETEWAKATHIQISINSRDRIMVTADPAAKEEMDRVFVADRINNKVMDAQTLQQQIDVKLNIDPATRVLTLLDADSLIVYEVTQISKANLTTAQKELLRTKGENGQVAECSAELKKVLPADVQEGCIIIRRFNVPVDYQKAELPVVGADGTRADTVQFKPATSGDKTGLVKITKNVMPEEVQPTGVLDPRKTLRLADIKDKEFFFRRTLEDVSAMGTLRGGMAGTLNLVKFVLEDDRIVVQKTVGAINFKNTTSMENEEVLSLPVVYFKRQTKDASGNNLAVAKFVPATKEAAEYASINWTNNTIPVLDSPLAFYADASCFANINNQSVVDTDMRMSEGVLSFSYLYSVTMAPSYACLSFFHPTNDYDLSGSLNTQFVQQVRERISFKVNDGSTDKAFVPLTPFNVQNALNYGVFTKGVIKPSDFGSYGREGDQVNFPTVHDFRNGKVFTYTVGGIPMDNPHRRDLLKRVATEVIADWNKALQAAFKDTPLQREGNYLAVQFVGENGVTGHLGDLDKNYVWFVDRAMDNGLLGVSQPGINPRSAVVAADSLIVYSGNNASQLEYFKKYYTTLRNFKKGLEDYKAKATAEDTKKAEAAKTEVEKQTVAEGVGAPAAQKLLNQLKAVRNAKTTPAERFTPNLGAISLKKSLFKEPLKIDKSAATAPKKKFGASQTVDGYIERIFKKAVEMNIATDTAALESLTAKEVLATYGSKLSAKQKHLLNQKAALNDMQVRMTQFYKNNPGCAFPMADVINDEMYANYMKMSDDEAFVVSTKTTLAHEMGHSLGLTHNFIASYDKANFTFAGEKSARNYSSIMDYINDSIQTYDGLGPYDVYAIRAAYTGLLEVRPEHAGKESISVDGLEAKLVAGRFIHIRDIKKSVTAEAEQLRKEGKHADNGWSNFTGRTARSVLMPFQYCTDKDVGYEPTCQRFDFGTTPVEIVKNIIKGYEDRYIVGRYAYDRLSFDWANKSSAISSAITAMFSMRQFYDEAFYRAILGMDEDGLDSAHFGAALEAYKFMLNVISTPGTNKSFMDYSRFEKVAYMQQQADGTEKPAIGFIEARNQSDVALTSERLQSIGNDIDKAIALQILTLKGIGMPKYDEMSLNVSFVDFEKYKRFMGDDGVSPITGTIAGILMNKLPGRIFADDGLMESQGEVTITSLLTSYAAITAVLGLEAEAISQTDNFANLFKVGSSLGSKAPTDRVALSPLGSVNNSQAKISFWALDNAKIANTILETANSKRFFMGLSDTLTADATKLVKAQAAAVVAVDAKDQAAAEAAAKEGAVAKAALLKALNEANKDGQIVTPEEVAQEPSFSIESQMDTIETMTFSVTEIALQLIKAQGNQAETEKAQARLDKFAAWVDEIGKGLPAVASAQKAAFEGLNAAVKLRTAELAGKPDAAKDLQLFTLRVSVNIAKAFFTAYQERDSEYGLLIRNASFLNQLTLMTNPEYNR
ncbi:zinc-dependent metalloprotease [Bdellovibrio sp. HCB337]|uniref:zinc-dependent metalloprotease n=1 Tax=Bdellovibrio sp. HCB337 TaxID=3394358 RepID=UPI0039A519A3